MDTAYDEYNLWIQLMMNTIYGYNSETQLMVVYVNTNNGWSSRITFMVKYLCYINMGKMYGRLDIIISLKYGLKVD